MVAAAATVGAPIAQKVFGMLASNALGNVFGGGEQRPITLRQYNPNQEGSGGWNWGDYGLGANFTDERKNVIDSLLRQRPGSMYRAQADMFKSPTRSGGPTGEASFYDKGAQQQSSYDRQLDHNLNSLYRQMVESGNYGALPDPTGNPYSTKTDARNLMATALGLNGQQEEQPTDTAEDTTTEDTPVNQLNNEDYLHSRLQDAVKAEISSVFNTSFQPTTYDFSRLNQMQQLPGKEGLNASALRSTALRNILKNSGNLR